MFAPPPLLATPAPEEHIDTPTPPKRRRVDSRAEENEDPNMNSNSELLAPGGSSCKPPALSSEQLARIEQNRLAALERKQQKDELGSEQLARIEQNRLAALQRKQQKACSQDVQSDAEKRALIEQNRLAALARKAALEQQSQEPACSKDPEAEKRARIEQNRLAALARKQQRVDQAQNPSSEAVPSNSAPEMEIEVDDAASSATPPTPSLSFSAPSTPSPDSDDASSDDSPSDSDSCSNSSYSSSDNTTSCTSSDSDSDTEETAPRPTLTAEQLAKIAQNRRAALMRKRGLTPEQLDKIEANRRAAMARKRGIGAEQFARMEENRRKAMERRQQKENANVEVPSKEEECEVEWLACHRLGIPPPKPVEKRDAKQILVAQLLCRWWFALPAWPPENFDFDAELSKLRFRRVPISTFDQESEVDEKGLRKAYELEQFKGCFRTSGGELLDVRPVEGRPSFDQLMLKSMPDLYRLLIAAFDAQLMELFAETQKKGASKELELHLTDLRKLAAKVRQKAMFYLSFTKGSAKKK